MKSMIDRQILEDDPNEVDELIKYGSIDLSTEGSSYMLTAVEGGSHKTVDYLVSKGININDFPTTIGDVIVHQPAPHIIRAARIGSILTYEAVKRAGGKTD